MHPIRLEIPKELFTPSEFHSYSEHATMDDLDFGGLEFSFPDGIDWKANITNTGGALLVQGKVAGVAKTQCMRCLEEASIPIEGDIEGYFLLTPDSLPPDDMEEDEFGRIGEDKTIEMSPLIESAILLELPQVPVCREDCAGICPHCGRNLNEGDCGCASEDEASSDSNPFSVLKDYDFGN